MNNRAIGTDYEKRACEFLETQGFSVLERNFRCRQGEIDIIARKGRILAFVEVKLRRDDRFAEAREFVTTAKQRRILAAAQLYLSAHPAEDLQPRFDVLELYAPKGESGPLHINHIEDAFM